VLSWVVWFLLCVVCGILLSHYVSYVEFISPTMCRMWNSSLPLCVVCGMHLSRYVSYVDCIPPVMCRLWNASLPLCVVCGLHPSRYVSYVECISPIMRRMWNASFHYMPCVKYITHFAYRRWGNIKKLGNEISRVEDARYPLLTRDW